MENKVLHHLHIEDESDAASNPSRLYDSALELETVLAPLFLTGMMPAGSSWASQMVVTRDVAEIATESSDTNNGGPIRALIAFTENSDEKRYRQRIKKVLSTVSRQVGREIHESWSEVAEEEAWRYGDELETSHLILLLVGPDFVDTDYCYSPQLQRAIENHRCGKMYVVPIYLRPCLLDNVPFGGLRFLPEKSLPVSMQNEDWAFQIIAEYITQKAKTIIDRLL